MAIILSTADLRYITGREARAMHKAANRYSSGVFKEFGDSMEVFQTPLETNGVTVAEGLCLVDGAIVENTLGETLTLNQDGVWNIIVRVNLTNGNNPIAEITATMNALVQEDLTINPNGTYEYSLATATLSAGSITELVDNRVYLEVDSPTIQYLTDNYYNKSETYNISDTQAKFQNKCNIDLVFTDSEFAGMDAAAILNHIYTTKFPSIYHYNDTVFQMRVLPANFPNFMRAFQNFIGNTGSTTPLIMVWDCKAALSNPSPVYIIENAKFKVHLAVYDNGILKKANLATGNNLQNRMYNLFSGQAYLESGQETLLNLHGYRMSDFEELILIFSHYKYGSGAVDSGFVTLKIPNIGIPGMVDGFYSTRTWQFNIDNASPGGNPDTAVKSWNVTTAGVLQGRSNGSLTNKNVVLREIVGVVSEANFNSLATRSLPQGSILNSLPLLSINNMQPDEPLIIMANDSHYYDLSSLADEQKDELRGGV